MPMSMIEVELPPPEHTECTVCKKTNNCRPFGVDGAIVCESCARQNPEAMKAGIQKLALDLAAKKVEAEGSAAITPLQLANADIQLCSKCGHLSDCRPYGPNGGPICYECAQKDWPAIKARIQAEERQKATELKQKKSHNEHLTVRPEELN